MVSNRSARCFLVLLFGMIASIQIQAASEYNQPSKDLLEVLQAPSPPIPVVSPTKEKLILVALQDFPSIRRVATPFLKLAGVRLEPQNRSRHDTPGGYGIPSCMHSLTMINVADGAEKKINISKLACADWPQWSADGRYFFLTNRSETSVELWVGDAKSASLAQMPGVKLNPIFDDEAQWMADQKNILVKLVPKNLGAVPKSTDTLVGPSIQETNGKTGQSSTYEKRDTLNNKYDEKLFDYYGSSQLALVNVQTKAVTLIGSPAVYEEVLSAPDNKHIFISQIVRPYSYIVTYARFPRKVEVLNIANPKKPSRSKITELPLADRVPVHGVAMGPRSFSWNPHDPATLVWAEALDGGDWNVKVPARDKIMQLAAPFTAAPKEIFQTEQRYSGLRWLEQRSIALLSEIDENRHWRKSFIVNPDDPKQERKLLWDLSTDEEYADPGSPIRKTLKNGFSVLRQNQDSIFLSGVGSSPDGDRPFLDKLDLKTLKYERKFRSDKAEYETFLSFIDDGESQFLTRHQTPNDMPNVYKRQIGAEAKSVAGEAQFESTRKALTHVPDPTPQVRQIKKRLVKYKRADGLDLSFTLYTPPGYQEGTRVPTILYAYPLDYADASKAGQVTGSQATFTRLKGYRLLLMAGYAIIDNAAFPIVGDPKRAYDDYTNQLVADAKAAVDQAVKMGVADPDRIGVTGHSHGALMTVNLLAHSKLFKAGIATSGSYNKTFTPFGFQSERRSVWEAPEVYRNVSPYFFADKIKSPLLIMHGAEDANPGTTPDQARFLYDAVRGNGGVTRLVMLPHEPHWYSALESNEQLVFEMQQWFDRYVKNANTSANTPK